MVASPSHAGFDERPGYDGASEVESAYALLLRLLLGRNRLEEKVPLSRYGGVAQLVERLTGSQEVRGFKSLRLHAFVQFRVIVWNVMLLVPFRMSSICHRATSRESCQKADGVGDRH